MKIYPSGSYFNYRETRRYLVIKVIFRSMWKYYAAIKMPSKPTDIFQSLEFDKLILHILNSLQSIVFIKGTRRVLLWGFIVRYK